MLVEIKIFLGKVALEFAAKFDRNHIEAEIQNGKLLIQKKKSRTSCSPLSNLILTIERRLCVVRLSEIESKQSKCSLNAWSTQTNMSPERLGNE